ncbi:Membrane-associated progesterone receptor component 1 [Scheffersomyces spartinae]|uniref:Membrane-associated progesterone receptor component 1 n=1 Tax=Scheffersomyces spartinae TaxID=45513 RepID=A0A9P7V9U4_9ASCO|nr:Membrane-associated progesterone receptor component 1 [Scheffersomyces spartinae]KAG7193855.1 Membrane-associated progesterone receptor component 1 [Scheffersomyces spartinae]
MISLNTALIILVFLFFIKSMVGVATTENPLEQAESDPLVIEGKFTPKTLARYNGIDNPRIFIAVKKRVFDVTQGATFYGPGGPYENFAGRDASRGLALNSFELSCLTSIDEPIDTLTGLTKEELESLDSWEQHFDNKYKVVGTLHENNADSSEVVPPPQPQSKKDA